MDPANLTPAEMWVEVFSALPELSELTNVAGVCQKWRSFINDNPEIWRTIHKRTFSIFVWVGEEPESWKEHAIKALQFAQTFWADKTKSARNWVSFGARLYKQEHLLTESLALFGQDDHFLSNPEANAARLCSHANILLKLQKFSESLGLIDRLLETQPGHVKGLTIKGNIYLEQGLFQEAKQAFDLARQGRDLDAEVGHLCARRELQEDVESDMQTLWHSPQLTTIHQAQLAFPDLVDAIDYSRGAYARGERPDYAAYLAATALDCSLREQQLEKTTENRFLPRFDGFEKVKDWYEKSLASNPHQVKVLLAYAHLLDYEISTRFAVDRNFHEKNRVALQTEMVAILRKVIALNAMLSEPYFLLGKTLYDLGNIEEAREMLLRAGNLGCTSEPFYHCLMQLICTDNYFSYPELAAREAVKAHDTNDTQLKFTDALLIKKDETSQVNLSKAKELLERLPPSRESLLKLGWVLEKQQYYAEAQTKYEAALQHILGEENLFNRTPTSSIVNRSFMSLLRVNEITKRYIDDLFAADIGIVRCLFRLDKIDASVAFLLNVIDFYLHESLPYAEKLLTFHTLEVPPMEHLLKWGELRYRQSDATHSLDYREEIVTTYQKATKLYPNSADPWELLFDYHSSRNDLEQAAECADRALTLDPNHLMCIQEYLEMIIRESMHSLYNRGFALAQQGLNCVHEMSNAELQEVSQHHDRAYWVETFYKDQIILHYLSGAMDQSTDVYTAFIAGRGGNENCRYWDIKDRKLQVDAFFSMEHFSPEHASKTDIMSVFLLQPLQFQKEVCDAVLAQNPDNIFVNCVRGLIVHDPEEALVYLETVFKQVDDLSKPFAKSLMKTLYGLYSPTNKAKTALAIANQMIIHQADHIDDFCVELAQNHSDDFFVQYNLGVVCYFKGEHEKAKQYLLQAVALNDNHHKAHYLLAQIFRELNDPESASDHQAKSEGEDPIPSRDSGLPQIKMLHRADFIEKPPES